MCENSHVSSEQNVQSGLIRYVAINVNGEKRKKFKYQFLFGFLSPLSSVALCVVLTKSNIKFETKKYIILHIYTFNFSNKEGFPYFVCNNLMSLISESR